MEDSGRRSAALARLNRKRAFRQGLAAYLIINAFLIIVWVVTGAGFFWPVFPIAGWGLAVAFQAYNAYGTKPVTEDDIQREISRGDRR